MTPMPTEHLSDLQLARLEALQAAATIGRKTNGPFAGSIPPEVLELVDLAEYILNGKHPLAPFLERA